MNNQLRFLLLEMENKDQEVRKKVGEAIKKEGNFVSTDKKLGKEMNDVDSYHTQRMKEIISEYGWPTISLVGKDASKAAWLLVQHADLDVDFQELCLNLIRLCLEDEEVDKSDYAYLYDRICVNKKKPQLFGTQFMSHEGKLISRPIEDEKNINKRRKEFGLEPFEEYKMKFLRKHNAI